jgi:hypothetical protein
MMTIADSPTAVAITTDFPCHLRFTKSGITPYKHVRDFVSQMVADNSLVEARREVAC